MQIARVIEESTEMWSLLEEIKKRDEHVFIGCLLGAFTGARFRELKALSIKDLLKNRIHLGTQLYKGTGRNVLLSEQIKPYIQEFCDKQLVKTQSILQRQNGAQVSFIEANRIVKEVADGLNLKGITVTSFRKTFGHKICPLLNERWLALDETGFKTNSRTNLHTMFDLKKMSWDE